MAENLSPAGLAASTIFRMSFSSSSVNSMSRDVQFSSKREGLVVPGIAINPCAATQARAICATEQLLRVANCLISLTIALFL